METRIEDLTIPVMELLGNNVIELGGNSGLNTIIIRDDSISPSCGKSTPYRSPAENSLLMSNLLRGAIFLHGSFLNILLASPIPWTRTFDFAHGYLFANPQPAEEGGYMEHFWTAYPPTFNSSRDIVETFRAEMGNDFPIAFFFENLGDGAEKSPGIKKLFKDILRGEDVPEGSFQVIYDTTGDFASQIANAPADAPWKGAAAIADESTENGKCNLSINDITFSRALDPGLIF